MSIEENSRAIKEREGGRIFELVENKVPALLRSQASMQRKYIRLTEIIDQVSALIAPNAPCKKGCSHCCKMAVGISAYEASLIAEHIGRGARKITKVQMPEENVDRFAGVPCTFLADDGTCEIYEVRPLACRSYHVIEDSSEGCDVTKNFHGKVASINLTEIEFAAATLLYEHDYGDIRDFFPRR